jgi:hypothetical protein
MMLTKYEELSKYIGSSLLQLQEQREGLGSPSYLRLLAREIEIGKRKCGLPMGTCHELYAILGIKMLSAEGLQIQSWWGDTVTDKDHIIILLLLAAEIQ